MPHANAAGLQITVGVFSKIDSNFWIAPTQAYTRRACGGFIEQRSTERCIESIWALVRVLASI